MRPCVDILRDEAGTFREPNDSEKDPITVAKCIMSLKPEEIDELLNGMLDGVLIDDEQRRLESALELDPSLQTRLDEMAALRSSLLRGRSVGRLGPDFAKRIVQAARERADLMDDPPEWIKPQFGTNRSEREPSRNSGRNRPSDSNDFSRSSSSSLGSSRPSKSRETQRIRSLLSSPSDNVDEGATRSSVLQKRALQVWLPSLLAVTAASAALFILSTQWTPSNPNGDIAVVAPAGVDSESDRSNSPDSDGQIKTGLDILRDPSSIAQGSPRTPENPGVENDAPNNFAVTDEPQATDRPNLDATPPSNQTFAAAPETPSDASSKIESDQKMPLPGVGSKSAIVDSNPKGTTDVVPYLAPAPWRSAALREAMIKQFGLAIVERMEAGKPYYTMLADVKADPQATDNNAIEALLEKHEITFADDLALDDEQLNVLVKSQFVGAVSQGADIARDNGINVYFLRAEAWRISDFVQDVQAQYRDFPEYRLDMLYDTSVLELEDQLGGISDPSNRVAHRIEHKSSTAEGNLKMVVGARQGKPLGLQERLAAKIRPADATQVKRTETSYLLLIVRGDSE